jgi:hypothetical protein
VARVNLARQYHGLGRLAPARSKQGFARDPRDPVEVDTAL